MNKTVFLTAASLLMMSSSAFSQEAGSPWYFSVDVGPSAFVMVPDSAIPILGAAINGTAITQTDLLGVAALGTIDLGNGSSADLSALNEIDPVVLEQVLAGDFSSIDPAYIATLDPALLDEVDAELLEAFGLDGPALTELGVDAALLTSLGIDPAILTTTSSSLTASSTAAAVAAALSVGGVLDPIAAAVGINGSFALCMAGVGSNEWLDLCGGITAFAGGTGTHTIAAGGTNVTLSSSLQSVGAFAQAKATMGIVTFAPMVGVRQIFAQTSISASIDMGAPVGVVPATLTYNGSETAVFGGFDAGILIFDGNGEIGLRAEIGRSISAAAGSEFISGSAGLFAKVNF